MNKISYFDPKIKQILSDPNAFLDSDVKEELTPVLETLKKRGEIEGANSGRKPGVSGLVYELKGRTFKLIYTVDTKQKKIIIYEFQQMAHNIDWQTTLEQDIEWNNEEPIYIPQIGDPQKFINAIKLIHSGVNTAKALGIECGSKAKKDKDIIRRGDYFGKPLISMNLVIRKKTNPSKQTIYVLTHRGKLIAESPDRATQERLFAEALLGFYPIQLILEKTTRDNKELTKELIQEIISQVSLDECGGTTNPRRASSLRALVNWVSRWAGIPVRRAGNKGVQLYIPYIYAN